MPSASHLIEMQDAINRIIQACNRVAMQYRQPAYPTTWEVTCDLCRRVYVATASWERKVCPDCWRVLEDTAAKTGGHMTPEMLTGLYRIRVNHHGIQYGTPWQQHVKDRRCL